MTTSVPLKQKAVFDEIATGDLSNLFHKSTNINGHSVKNLLKDIVRIVRPELIYLSDNFRTKITRVHRELLNLMRTEGDGVYIDIENVTPKTEQAVQAIVDLKSDIRLFENDIDNFYLKIVLPAVKNSGTLNMVDIDKDDMNPNIVTDIYAWREALTKVLISIKQHSDKSESIGNIQGKRSFIIKFIDENPVNGSPRAIEIYRRNIQLPFNKKLEIDINSSEGKVDKWLTGGDLSFAVKEFLPIGDIFAHGNFNDCNNATVNLTENLYKIDGKLKLNDSGKLFFSLQEIKE